MFHAVDSLVPIEATIMPQLQLGYYAKVLHILTENISFSIPGPVAPTNLLHFPTFF